MRTSFREPFYSGSGTSSQVGVGGWHVSIAGHNYQIDTDTYPALPYGTRYKVDLLPVIREQSDAGPTPGEHSINPQNYWRRSFESWNAGAGQTYYDRNSSLDSRFRASKGVDPWTQWRLTLLNDTSKALNSANSGLKLCVAGAWVYVCDGTTVRRSTDLTTWTALTGGPAAAATGIDTDGFNVYVAFAGTNGVYSTNTGSTVLAAFVTTASETVTLVSYQKRRLFCATASGKLYNITSPTVAALPTPLLDLSAQGWTWTDFSVSKKVVHASGFTGDKSAVYALPIKTDGTGMDVPYVGVELPDGEIVRSLGGYLGFLAVGTDKGVRFAQVDDSGYATLGSLTPLTAAVYCFEGQDRFIWFGWSNYDSTSTGLGRLDLSTFTTTALTPAYASDLMTTAQGTVRSVVTFAGKRLFTVDGQGVFKETAVPVAQGTLQTGRVAFGLADPKVAVGAALRHDALPTGATVAVALTADGGSARTVITSNTAGTTQPSGVADAGQARGELFELTLTLSCTTVAPVVTRLVLFANPAPPRTRVFTVPLILSPAVEPYDSPQGVDVHAERAFLEGLTDSGQVVTFQTVSDSYSVVMDDFSWLPDLGGVSTDFTRGTFVATLREISV